MRVAIDVRSLMDRPTGIGRYVRQIVGQFVDPRAHDVILFSFGGRVPSPPLHALLHATNISFVHLPAPMRAIRALWRTVGGPTLERFIGPVDAVIAAETTVPRTAAPVVAVVHDCLWSTHPEWFNAYTRRAGPENLADVAARAAAAIAVSARTASEVIRLYPALAARLQVVPPAVEPVTPVPKRRRANDLVLFAGTREPRKGLGTLARALLRARGAASRARLVVVGGRGWGSPEGRDAWEFLERVGRCESYGYANDATLARLRSTCALAAIPSFDEGFGLPLLEAMSAGAPALAADTEIFREVGGDAVARAVAGDVDAWADALDALLGDDRRRSHLAAAGLDRARLFSRDRQRARLASALATVGVMLDP